MTKAFNSSHSVNQSKPDAVRPSVSRGISLITVLLILVVVSLLGIGSAQIAVMAERSARNDRDQQMAWQSVEAGLIDAELDLWSPISTRSDLFDGKTTYAFPTEGCSSMGKSQGLCAAVLSGKPAWLTVNFTDNSPNAPSAAFGAFTSRSFNAGSAGIQPAQAPRYVIEPVLAQSGDKAAVDKEVLYRVTTMGFGPRSDIQSVLQILYRI